MCYDRFHFKQVSLWEVSASVTNEVLPMTTVSMTKWNPVIHQQIVAWVFGNTAL